MGEVGGDQLGWWLGADSLQSGPAPPSHGPLLLASVQHVDHTLRHDEPRRHQPSVQLSRLLQELVGDDRPPGRQVPGLSRVRHQVEELDGLEVSLDPALAVLRRSVSSVQHPRLAPDQFVSVVPDPDLTTQLCHPDSRSSHLELLLCDGAPEEVWQHGVVNVVDQPGPGTLPETGDGIPLVHTVHLRHGAVSGQAEDGGEEVDHVEEAAVPGVSSLVTSSSSRLTLCWIC